MNKNMMKNYIMDLLKEWKEDRIESCLSECSDQREVKMVKKSAERFYEDKVAEFNGAFDMPEVHSEMDFIIPLNEDESVKKINKKLGTNFKVTEDYIDQMLEEIGDMVCKVAEDGGLFVNDSIKVSVSVEYCPENK